MRKNEGVEPNVSLWKAATAALHGGLLGLFLAILGLIGYGDYLFGQYAVNALSDEDLSFTHALVGFCAGRLAEMRLPWISAYAEKVAGSPDCAFVFRWPAVYWWFAIHESLAWQIIGLGVLIFAVISLVVYTIRQMYRLWRQAVHRQPRPAGDW
jgi:hypothetical protein